MDILSETIDQILLPVAFPTVRKKLLLSLLLWKRVLLTLLEGSFVKLNCLPGFKWLIRLILVVETNLGSSVYWTP